MWPVYGPTLCLLAHIPNVRVDVFCFLGVYYLFQFIRLQSQIVSFAS